MGKALKIRYMGEPMTKEKIIPPQNGYRLLNPGPVVVISVGDVERDNLFMVTWDMPVRKTRPGACKLYE